LNTLPLSDRQTAIDDVLAELTVWTPRERQDAFRAWVRGSLSLVHLHVLTILEGGPLPMSRLAESLDVSDASATGIVDRMEDRKLVERRSDQVDRRVVVVHATRRGSRVFDALAKERRARLKPILTQMTDEEIASFLVGLRAMRRIRLATAESSGGASR
jgi:DNA-binding MarR family transcriptional regulator